MSAPWTRVDRSRGSAGHVVRLCVTTETRHLDRLGQLGEFEQESNTGSEQESNTDSHSARSKAQAHNPRRNHTKRPVKQRAEHSANKPLSNQTETKPGQSRRPLHITGPPQSRTRKQRKGGATPSPGGAARSRPPRPPSVVRVEDSCVSAAPTTRHFHWLCENRNSKLSQKNFMHQGAVCSQLQRVPWTYAYNNSLQPTAAQTKQGTARQEAEFSNTQQRPDVVCFPNASRFVSTGTASSKFAAEASKARECRRETSAATTTHLSLIHI